MCFLREVFSDGGTGSFGRVGCIPTLATACFAVVYLVLKNHASPDALTIGALAAFAVSPYTAGKVAGIWSGSGTTKP